MKHHRDNRSEIYADVQRLLLGVVAIAIPSRAMGSFTGVVLFGDSYSDVGNVYEQTSHALPPSPPYHSGRWSNGPIWCEQLTLDLNFPGPTPSLLGGGGYAYAGARTGSGSTVYAPFAALNLGAQVNSYLSSNTPAPDELFSVWGGANDFILGQTNSSVPVNNIAAHVTALAIAGARQFVVPNMVPLGQLPRYRGTPDEPVLDALSLQFNVELSSTLTSLESSLNVRIWRLDAAGLLQEMLTNPSAYGLTNVTNTALVGGTPVSNPDEYLFWDDQHATRVFHRILGGLAAELVLTHEWESTQAASNWSAPGNWQHGAVPDAPGVIAVFGSAATGPATVTVDTPITVGTIRFNNSHAYTVAGTNPLTLNATSGAARLDVISGSHLISAPLVLADNATITVTPSASVLTLTNLQPTPGRTLTKAGAGQVEVNRIQADGLAINAGGIAILSNGTSAATSKVASLTIAGETEPTATLDLTNNALVVDYTGDSPLPVLRAQIITGYDAGLWEGNGIVSSNANGSTHGVGYAEASSLPVVPAIFGSVDDTSVLVRYTRYGDANLDGLVNLDDFNRLAGNFGSTSALWSEGDFTYDGRVNLDDFNRLAGGFGLSAAPDGPTPQEWAALAAEVPEPGVLWLGAAAVALAFERRRPRRSRDIEPADERI